MRNNLINARKNSRLTQERIAESLNITTQHYQRLEAGTSDGSIKIWQQLAKQLNVTIDYLLEQAEDTPQANCNTQQRDSIAEAKALHSAAKDFMVTPEVLLDVADTGKIDDPQHWKAAKQFHEALGAALI